MRAGIQEEALRVPERSDLPSPDLWLDAVLPLIRKRTRHLMPYPYEGLATVTVVALYPDQPPIELTTEELPIVLRNAGANRVRVEFDRYLRGPKEANVLRIELPEGWLFHGPIVAGRNEPGGGWLEFEIEQHDMSLAPPQVRDDWEWQ